MIHAVLVGINEYADAPLRFCINDTDDVKEFLLSTAGLKPENSIILKNERATKSNILNALIEKVALLKSGDILYFHFSGHGTQVPNKFDAWESDGLDEVLCPYFKEWSPSAFIKDDEIFQILSQKVSDAFVVFMADCCHSGDLGRSLRASGNPKFIKIPEWLKNIFSNQPPATESPLKSINYTLSNVVVLSACDSKQVAMDGGPGIDNGRFTHELLKSLNAKPNKTFEQLVSELQYNCRGVQTPQLQCAKILRKRTFINPKPYRSRAKTKK